jgi:membrane fusion protein (multidrug efflux system)
MAMRPEQRFGLRGLGLAVGCLLMLALAGCEHKKQAAPPPPPPEVGLTTVAKQTVPIVLELSGTITPVKQVQIIPRVSGFIFERYFTEGTFVEKDAPLYLIDPRPFEDTLARLQAQIEGQRASLEFWQSEKTRYDKLAKQGAASKEKAEGVRAKLDVTRADIDKTKAEIRTAELDLSFTKINAPFYGRVQQTQINVGNLVQAQRDVLTELVQMDPIYVVFNVSRAQAYQIQTKQREGVAFKTKDMVVELIMPDGQLYAKKGKVNFVSILIDPTTDSVTVRGIFDNPKNDTHGFDLTPGQYTPVRLNVGNKPDALVIPQAATVETQAGTHVYVVGEDNKVERRVIKAGVAYKQLVVVDDGLKEGEKVISVGVQKVKDGIEVKPTAASVGQGQGGDEPKPATARVPANAEKAMGGSAEQDRGESKKDAEKSSGT